MIQLAGLAQRYDAVDILLFHQVAPGRFALAGGHGRGLDWAATVEVDLESDQWLAETVHTGRVQRIQTRNAVRVLGPYYARTAVVVPVDAERIVVWGSAANAPLFAATADDDLIAISARAADVIVTVSPARLLEDELRLLEAVQALTAGLHLEFPEALQHIAAVAAEALLCEVAVGLTGSGQLSAAYRGWAPDAEEATLQAVLTAEFVNRMTITCVQDAWDVPLPAPLAPELGIRSYVALPLPEEIGGFLFAAHSVAHPRGFTQLCLRIAEVLTDAAGVLLQVASLRTAALTEQVEDGSLPVRSDSLTGLGTRVTWQEALQNAQLDVDTGQTVTLVSIDVDLLKQTNDEYGQRAGDRLLCTIADLLRDTSRGGDLVCRVGGDEFALLLHHQDLSSARRISERLHGNLAAARSPDGLPVRVSIGMATAQPGASLLQTMHAADVAMYTNKQARRNQLT